jgi:hypothetical protein
VVQNCSSFKTGTFTIFPKTFFVFYYKLGPMPKPLPLKIRIDKPCSETWANMNPQGEGRFCENCKQIIVDFSGMTDQELFYYFQNNKNVHCGRFHNDQLNKHLLPAPPKKFTWKYFYKAAVTLFAFLSMKDAGAGMIKNKPAIEISPGRQKPQVSTHRDKIVISGVVTNSIGEALEDVEIKFGDLVTKTSKDGTFQFELSAEQAAKSTLLVITYPGMVPVVRNYHSMMQSTSYTITLSPPLKMYPVTMGVISSCEYVKTPDHFINWTTTEFSKETKALLVAWAVTMRNHPEFGVTITGFAKTKTQNKIIQKRAERIKQFLVDEGISEERFRIAVEVDPEMTDIVQLELRDREE